MNQFEENYNNTMTEPHPPQSQSDPEHYDYEYSVSDRLSAGFDQDHTVRLSNRAAAELNEGTTLLNHNMCEKLKKYKLALKNRSLLVDLFSIFFGIGAWIGINSIFLQLPLLVENAPEGWSLPSYLVVMVQIGNIGPIGYTLCQKFLPKSVKDSYMIYLVLSIGTISALLTSFLYKYTMYIYDKEYSISLYVLVFCLALNGCTSSVLFMPYMGRFREIYMITYFIGEGLSGFLPSIVALIQGVGGNAECLLISNGTESEEKYEKYQPPARFGTMEFFIFVFVIMIFSTVAFLLLDNLKLCKKQFAAVKITSGNNYVYEKTTDNNNKTIQQDSFKQLTKTNYILLMILMAVVCMFGNGVIPSVQSYSCLPYGNVVYHLTVTLSAMANPVACFLAMFLPLTSIRSILILSGSSGIIAAYALTTALLSPNPPLLGSLIGEILVIISWTILVGLVSFVKLCITIVMRSQGGKSLVWIGAISQAGSAIGSVLIFLLVNYTKLFVQYDPC